MTRSASINFRNTLAALFVLLAAAIGAYSQTPAAPDTLGGDAVKHGGSQFVRLWWIADTTGGDIDGFYIYMANGQTDDLNNFSLHRNIPLDSLNYKYRYEYFAQIYNLSPGYYTFYVTAYNEDGESGRSNFRVVRVNEADLSIRFSSTPVNYITVNTEYSYTAQAEASNGGTVAYRLSHYPEGMTIDESTGEISWTPQESGVYNINVIAYIQDAPEVWTNQNFDLLALSCSVPATISGTVTDMDNNLLDGGTVTLIKISTEGDSVGFNKYAHTSRITNGEYYFDLVDEGSYYLMAYAQGFQSEWYDNARERQDATIIEIECANDYNFGFQLQRSYNDVRIEFTSTPGELIRVNQEYTYTVTAEASDDMEVAFMLLHGPDGAEFDENTNTISWTPTESGYYEFTVKAYLVAQPGRYSLQSFTVRVVNCDNLAGFAGFVNYEDGTPVQSGYVYIYSSLGEADSNGFRGKHPTVEARIENGMFVSPQMLDAGMYYIQFHGESFYGEWWENQTSSQTAIGYVLECGDRDTITVTLSAKPVVHYYGVTGTVRDQTDNSVIPYMTVEFFGTEINTNAVEIFVTYTGQNGMYDINLPDNYTYIARTAPMDSLRNFPGQNYLPMYYNQRTDPTEADVITLTGNMNGVDFILSPRPTYENQIYGTVTDENGEPIENAWVVCYLVETLPNNMQWIYQGKAGITNSEGVFGMENLIPGDYVLLAYSPTREFIPGYYVLNQYAVQSWRDATRVTVEEEGASGSYNIMLEIREIVPRGHGRFHGWCGRRHGIIKSDGRPQGNDALAGALVFAKDNDNTVVDYCFTASDGEYSLDGLRKGIYKLAFDKVGYVHYNETEELESDNDVKSGNIELEPEATTSVETEVTANVNVYPNPASEFVNITFKAKSGAAQISLINALGNTVLSSKIEAVDGANTAVAVVSGLASGMYFIKIENNETTTVIPVAIAK